MPRGPLQNMCAMAWRRPIDGPRRATLGTILGAFVEARALYGLLLPVMPMILFR